MKNLFKLRYALKFEESRLKALLPNYLGQHLLQLGGYNLTSLAKSPILHKICVNHSPLISNYSYLQSTYTNLPFADNSVNLIILPHTLELDKKNARLILNETWRLMAPNGHLVLLGINPFSLWGLYRLFSFNGSSTSYGNFHSIQKICQWIYYLGGEICHTETFLFRPPLTSNLGRWLFSKLIWVEKLSPWLFPYLGGVYLIIAQKKVKRPNKLGLIWQFPAPILNDKALATNARGIHFV